MSRAEATRRVGWLRRRMPRHLLLVFCLSLLLLGCACGPAYAGDGAPVKSVPLFVSGRTKVPQKSGDEVSPDYIDSFSSPFLVAGNGVMVVLAEARYTEKLNEGVDIVARYIDTEGANWADNTTEHDGDNWRTQLILQGRAGVNYAVLRNPTAVIKGDKIYLLVLNNTRPNGSSQNGDEWHFEVAVGAIAGEVGSKNIEWGPSDSLHFKLTQEVEKQGLSVFPGSSNSAFLTSKGTIVFSANATKKEGFAPSKPGFAIMQLKDDKEQWEVSFVEKPKECSLFSLFEWKERLVSIFSGCSTGNGYVKEHDEVNEEWKDTDDALLYSLSGKDTSRDLTSVTIENKSALLFTGESVSANGKSKISLFYTDGNRMHRAGLSIEISYVNVISSRLLYTNGELFFMYQDADNGSGAIVLTRLDDELKDIKSVLNDWARNDAYLSKPCNETAPKGAFPDTLCVTPMPTDGLVGFLSENNDDFFWCDEYRFTSAWVSGRKVKNGHTFSGTGEGAWWPVGETYSSKGYDFTKYGLTVVATVAVHETPENDAPLLSVYGVEVDEIWGLWYKGGQWKIVSKNGDEGPTTDFETQKEYRVALILHNNTISMYVDGNSQGGPLPISAPGEKPFVIKNIFIGGYGHDSWIHMTVTNVLVYNRVLSDTELEAISKRIATATSTDSDKAHESPNDSSGSTDTRNLPQLGSKTPTNPGDSSVCARMGFTSPFLLGCFCFAFFW